MRAFPRFNVMALSAALTMLSSTAYGVADPDANYSTFTDWPTNRAAVCLNADCSSMFYYSTQHFDCSRAGNGAPRPIETVNPQVNYADFESLQQSFFANPFADSSDLNHDGVVDFVDLGIFYNMLYGGSDPYAPQGFSFADLAAGSPAYVGRSDTSTASDQTPAASDSPRDEDDTAQEDDKPPAPAPEDLSSAKGGMQLGAGQTVAQGSLSFDVAGDAGGAIADAAPEPVQYKLMPNYQDVGANLWPGNHFNHGDFGHQYGPVGGIAPGSWNLGFRWNTELTLRANDYDSINVSTPVSALSNAGLGPWTVQQQVMGDQQFTTLQFPPAYRSQIERQLQKVTVFVIETNWCRMVLIPEDPSFKRTGKDDGNSWGVRMDDQWAIKRVGFTDDEQSAWNQLPDNASPVVVAVVDTGLDWHHRDISAENIWRNPGEIADNGIDDDGNGYVDDVIGWNFLAKNNIPWDFDGHGTVVAGIIAAAQNDTGIAGINPHVQIMVLKGINNFGTTRASYIAEAIKYATDNGARIINLSVGGPHTSAIEQAAIEYAHRKGVLIVAASGNEGIELDDYGPGGTDEVLTVGATHTDNRAAAFSNFGKRVDLVAPGVDVLSLRARFTDANYRPASAEEGSDEYVIGTRFVGDDKRYLLASGTSFSTPIVAGVASLLMSKDPNLSAAEVRRILEETATDVDMAGNDKFTGHGMVNAQAALRVDPDFSVMAEITSVEKFPAEGPQFARVKGTIDASTFKRAWVQIGPGENPGGWRYVGRKHKFPVTNGTLATIPLARFDGYDMWTVVVNVEHKNGVIKRASYSFKLR